MRSRSSAAATIRTLDISAHVRSRPLVVEKSGFNGAPLHALAAATTQTATMVFTDSPFVRIAPSACMSDAVSRAASGLDYCELWSGFARRLCARRITQGGATLTQTLSAMSFSTTNDKASLTLRPGVTP